MGSQASELEIIKSKANMLYPDFGGAQRAESEDLPQGNLVAVGVHSNVAQRNNLVRTVNGKSLVRGVNRLDDKHRSPSGK